VVDRLNDDSMSDALEAEILALGDAAYAASQVPDDGLPVDPATVYMPNLAKFLPGDARLDAMLTDTETRAEVDAIVDEMRQIDRAYKMGREPQVGGEDTGQGSPATL
jgi:hypothetical protein